MDYDEIDAVVCSNGKIPSHLALHKPLLNEAFSFDTAHALGLRGVITVYDVCLKDTRLVDVGYPVKTVEAVAPSEHNKLWKEHKKAVDRIKELEVTIDAFDELGASLEKRVEEIRVELASLHYRTGDTTGARRILEKNGDRDD